MITDGEVYKSNVSLQSGLKTSTFTEHTPSAWEIGEDVQKKKTPKKPPKNKKTPSSKQNHSENWTKFDPPIIIFTITNSLLTLHSWEKDKKN